MVVGTNARVRLHHFRKGGRPGFEGLAMPVVARPEETVTGFAGPILGPSFEGGPTFREADSDRAGSPDDAFDGSTCYKVISKFRIGCDDGAPITSQKRSITLFLIMF